MKCNVYYWEKFKEGSVSLTL
ncbi:tetracycline resistance efflux system leader peptide [Aneurinibacillus aneurinilyticus]|uniref:Uncharacterized protein n=1 Tax=Aneurinibacillus aneurinilyticus TaxID=1391 RepID=A0A848D0T0_ANEAE|nr:hypothetical protein [Aneurinibacillus aneurinilyticus]